MKRIRPLLILTLTFYVLLNGLWGPLAQAQTVGMIELQSFLQNKSPGVESFTKLPKGIQQYMAQVLVPRLIPYQHFIAVTWKTNNMDSGEISILSKFPDFLGRSYFRADMPSAVYTIRWNESFATAESPLLWPEPFLLSDLIQFDKSHKPLTEEVLLGHWDLSISPSKPLSPEIKEQLDTLTDSLFRSDLYLNQNEYISELLKSSPKSATPLTHAVLPHDNNNYNPLTISNYHALIPIPIRPTTVNSVLQKSSDPLFLKSSTNKLLENSPMLSPSALIEFMNPASPGYRLLKRLDILQINESIAREILDRVGETPLRLQNPNSVIRGLIVVTSESHAVNLYKVIYGLNKNQSPLAPQIQNYSSNAETEEVSEWINEHPMYTGRQPRLLIVTPSQLPNLNLKKVNTLFNFSTIHRQGSTFDTHAEDLFAPSSFKHSLSLYDYTGTLMSVDALQLTERFKKSPHTSISIENIFKTTDQLLIRRNYVGKYSTFPTNDALSRKKLDALFEKANSSITLKAAPVAPPKPKVATSFVIIKPTSTKPMPGPASPTATENTNPTWIRPTLFANHNGSNWLCVKLLSSKKHFRR